MNLIFSLARVRELGPVVPRFHHLLRFAPMIGLAFLASLAASSIGQAKSSAPEIPSFSDVSVHDPSVIKAGERFYVYGSHGASAWTEDLRHWTQVAFDVSTGNPPHFDTFQSELSELIDWTQATTLWAADVIQLANGKFYYYYNVWTNHLSYRSYLGVAVSDTIEGPFSDLGEVLKAGTGVVGFDPYYDPNTIDPCLFYDAEGGLWMVYGSYSGGIYILATDPATGFPFPGQEWGTKLLGGAHQLIEGPFIEYNAETGFYYLWVSYGGLGAYDGYNMRVFRSESPDGPYYDPSGTDMSDPGGAPYETHGLKQAGNWQFLPAEGEISKSTGYRSPGHNSVIQDPDTGKWFNVFHTRFQGRGEAHEVRVHQMYFNEDGWPVMAPHRYAGESLEWELPSAVAGSYKLITHGKDISGSMKYSELIELKPNGKVAGAASGTWSYGKDKYIDLVLDGILYRGVFSTQWDDDQGTWVNAFSAVSGDGISVWGSEVVADKNPQVKLLADRNALYGYEFDFAMPDPEGSWKDVYSYSIVDGPEGLTVDRESGILYWDPSLTQVDVPFEVIVSARNIAADDHSQILYSFTLTALSAKSVQRVTLEFDGSETGGVLDQNGDFTGFTTRLPGTGGDVPAADPNLLLNPSEGVLELQSTPSDLNGGAGLNIASMPGINLADLGFDGTGDFAVTAEFGPIPATQFVDQFGLFVGSDTFTSTRAGTITWDFTFGPPSFNAQERYSTNVIGGWDIDAHFFGFGFDGSDGMTVTIQRIGGLWGHFVDGVQWDPGFTPFLLDGQANLTAGVFAINPVMPITKTVEVERFTVALVSDQLNLAEIEQWRILNFGTVESIGNAADKSDPDKDKRNNKQEFEDGTDPLVPDVAP